MKHFALLFPALILLVACSPASSGQNLSLTPNPTNTPLPSATPAPTSTPLPTLTPTTPPTIVEFQSSLAETNYGLVWEGSQGRLTYAPEGGLSISLPGTVDADGSLHITLPDGENVVVPLSEGAALGEYRAGPAILDPEAVPAYMLNAEKTAWVEVALPEIWTDPARPEKYPVIAWEDITSGLYAKALHQAYEQGLIPPFPPQAFNTGKFFKGDPTRAGFSGPSFDPRVEDFSKYITDPSTRPLRWVAYGVTELSGERFVLSVEQILNPDGNTDFLTYLTKEEPWFRRYYQEYLKQWSPNSDVNIFPITRFRKIEDCQQYMTTKAYCDWFWPRQEEIKRLAEEWVATGNVPKALERIPVFGIPRSW